jgi:hypothetical protein
LTAVDTLVTGVFGRPVGAGDKDEMGSGDGDGFVGDGEAEFRDPGSVILSGSQDVKGVLGTRAGPSDMGGVGTLKGIAAEELKAATGG